MCEIVHCGSLHAFQPSCFLFQNGRSYLCFTGPSHETGTIDQHPKRLIHFIPHHSLWEARAVFLNALFQAFSKHPVYLYSIIICIS
jgi:hypothetical protein